MGVYILRRLVHLIPILLVISAMVFVLTRLTPGDPALMKMGAQATLPENREALERLRAEMGLDKPIVLQYFIWLGNAATGNLGNSYWSGRPVMDLILGRMPATLQLMVTTIILSLVISVPISIIAALRPGSLLDKGLMLFSVMGQAVPIFWLGLALILLFAVQWRILPASGYVPFAEDPLESIRRSLLPAIVLSTREIAIFTKFLRSELIDVLNQDYIRSATAKGLTQTIVVRRHAMKNSLIPFITVVGLEVGALLSGVVIVEQVFGWSGVGWLSVQAVLNRDYTLVQASVLIVCAIFVFVNLFVDILYFYLNPRLRESLSQTST
ncbi:MAG: ABC transporter permease [Anaerolineae bacterium]|nr:ABC transporter permease [Anaerolineae bacterium]